MEKYQAIHLGKKRKIKEHFVIYKVVKKEDVRNFCFTLLQHAGFMNSRSKELNSLIKDAVSQYPEERHFEYTGSHFEPVSNPVWLELPWAKI